jgi:hypothetical protein
MRVMLLVASSASRTRAFSAPTPQAVTRHNDLGSIE